ncbi:MAG TPA: hypothetical protein VMZ30_16885, partial [Pyrinomonadaceae bacterium]|nr:hypothetical protein [Pyrinomonadaceae bacterium]
WGPDAFRSQPFHSNFSSISFGEALRAGQFMHTTPQFNRSILIKRIVCLAAISNRTQSSQGANRLSNGKCAFRLIQAQILLVLVRQDGFAGDRLRTKCRHVDYCNEPFGRD